MTPEEHLKRAELEIQSASHAARHNKPLSLQAAQVHIAHAQAQIDLRYTAWTMAAYEETKVKADPPVDWTNPLEDS